MHYSMYPAEQLSTSVLAEQLSTIEVGGKTTRCLRVRPANAITLQIFMGTPAPRSPHGSYATVLYMLSNFFKNKLTSYHCRI